MGQHDARFVVLPLLEVGFRDFLQRGESLVGARLQLGQLAAFALGLAAGALDLGFVAREQCRAGESGQPVDFSLL